MTPSLVVFNIRQRFDYCNHVVTGPTSRFSAREADRLISEYYEIHSWLLVIQGLGMMRRSRPSSLSPT